MPKHRPTKYQLAMQRIKAGESLCRGYKPRKAGDDTVVFAWWFEPSGRSCWPATAVKILREGAVRPAGDGLLDDGNSQTYVAA